MAEQMSVQIQMQIVVSAATTVGISNSRRLVFLPLLLYSVSSSSSYLSFMFPSFFPLFDIQHAHTRLLFIALLSFFSLFPACCKGKKFFPVRCKKQQQPPLKCDNTRAEKAKKNKKNCCQLTFGDGNGVNGGGGVRLIYSAIVGREVGARRWL